VEDVAMTNDDVQNVEMTLGGEIGEAKSDLREATRVWGDHCEAMTWEWEQEKAVMVAVMQAQQRSLETLHTCVRTLMDTVGTLQEREITRVHHARNPIVIDDVEEMALLDGSTDVEEVVPHIVTELVEIID
jgi:hypothetical protein